MSKNILFFESCVKIENDIWFSSVNYNGLYRYNLIEKKVERIADFPNENMWLECLHYKVCLYNHFLIFVPHLANNISIFDTVQRSFKQIAIPYLGKEFDVDGKFLEGVVYKDNLYVIGCHYPGILKVDLKTYKIEIVYCDSEKPRDFDGIYFGNNTAVCKNLLYIPVVYKNAILIYDMDCDKASQLKIGKPDNQYIRIINDDSRFYLVTKNSNHIVIWDKDKNNCKEIETNFRTIYNDVLTCSSEKYIWVISVVSDEIYKIDKRDDTLYYFDLKCSSSLHFIIDYAAPYKEGICLYDSNSTHWYYVDENGILTNLEISIEEPRNKEEIWKGFNKMYLNMIESERLPLEYLMFRVCEENSLVTIETASRSTGKVIWNVLSREA